MIIIDDIKEEDLKNDFNLWVQTMFSKRLKSGKIKIKILRSRFHEEQLKRLFKQT